MTERIERLKRLVVDQFGYEENPWISKRIADNAFIGTSPCGYFSYKGKFNDFHWRDRKAGVEGLSNFLKNLENFRAEMMHCYSLVERKNGRRYEIHTDPEINVLVGILRFPVPDVGEPYRVRLKKIRDLIARSYGSPENPWISKKEAEKAKIRASYGEGGSISNFRSIYERRGRWNESQGHGIEGYDCLLPNLAGTDAKAGLIHWVIDSTKREYAIFTDSEITELFGILRFPEGWADRPRGLDLLKPRQNR